MEATTEEDGDISQDPDIQPWPGHLAPEDVNNSSSPVAGVLQVLDIRRQPRTSGACLRAETGLRPMYPSPTYPFVDLDYIYSSPSSI